MRPILTSLTTILSGFALVQISACSGQGDQLGPDEHGGQEITENTGGTVPEDVVTPHATGGTGGTSEYNLPEQTDPDAPVCGDSKIVAGEGCDDGNNVAADGCGADCLVEPGFICLEPGVPCFPEICGDGSRTASETCDDGNAVDGDGCSSVCLVEAGWVCPSQGSACIPKCGDGILAGTERCDDGNTAGGDGCGPGCLVEPGWFDCPPNGPACTQAVCGNGVVEANEGCDDANDISGDGCNGSCLREPVFDAGVATAVCGDGARTLGEACDDGNLLAGDGCGPDCTIEVGFECVEQSEEPETVRLPVTYRDFTDAHPNFEVRSQGLDPGITGEVCTVANFATCGQLDAERKPTFHGTDANYSVTTAEDFNQWYRDVPDVNLTFPDAMDLTRMVSASGQTIYRFESNEFFPLDGLGFGNYIANVGETNERDYGHNFHFTTELEYFIQYAGGELLEFSGDDDVWIYVNGRLAVDIGGIHAVEDGSVLLGDENADGVIDATEEADLTDDRFGITKGELYQIKLFHAERFTIYSNFMLTLSNFILSRSVCDPICGSGTIEPGEFCDDGEALNTGEYGACKPDCSGREFCGDGIVQPDYEACDDGMNQAPYDTQGTGCAPGCVLPARCGDAVLNPEYGETCDLGDELNGVEDSGCDTSCHLVEIVK